MTSSLLPDWTADQFATLEKGTLLAPHGLHEMGYFGDEHLARLIDNHPDEALTISTMGEDTNTFEWREGDRNGVSGQELLRLVYEGRLWINCRNVLDHHADIHDLVHGLYDTLEENATHFQARERSANLLISSPQALVHYHIDIPVNMLWHLRGRKRVWVYPFFDFRFVAQHVVEMVCAGELTEDVPYDPEFDCYALVFDVEPGQLLTWPQMTPHRVTNLDGLNVSLSTEHKNPTAVRRIHTHLANQWLRRHVGAFYEDTPIDSWRAHAKQALSRGLRVVKRLRHSEPEQFVYRKSFQVDPRAPGGIVVLNRDDAANDAPHLDASRLATSRA